MIAAMEQPRRAAASHHHNNKNHKNNNNNNVAVVEIEEQVNRSSRARSRSFHNSPPRKELSRCARASKAYSLDSVRCPKRWRPCQLLRDVFAKTPLLLFGRRAFGGGAAAAAATTSARPSVVMTPADSTTFSSEDSGQGNDSPSSLASVLDSQLYLQPPKTRRSCSADSAVDLVGGGCAVSTAAASSPPPGSHHRTSLPSDRKRPLAQCLSLSCPVLSAPSVVVSDFSGGSSEASPEVVPEEEGCGLLSIDDDVRDYLSLGRSCSTCSLSSTVSSISWDDDASHSDVSESSSCFSSSKVSLCADHVGWGHAAMLLDYAFRNATDLGG